MNATSPGKSLSRGSSISRAVARATAPLSRPLAGRRFFPLWAVLRHRGRRTGRLYAVPVAVRATTDEVVIALPWGDSTQWLRNVLAAGSCSMRWRGEDRGLIEPAVVDYADAAAAFTPVQRWILRIAGVERFLRLRWGDYLKEFPNRTPATGR
jgi:deazaflavin-dependent oxidoreductase (nitroreductase family)